MCVFFCDLITEWVGEENLRGLKSAPFEDVSVSNAPFFHVTLLVARRLRLTTVTLNHCSITLRLRIHLTVRIHL